MSPTTDLQGKHALISGGARGIGLAITRLLVQHGARVSVTGRMPQRPELLHEFTDHGLGYCSMDVCDSQSVKHAFSQARQQFGAVHILINNAGQAASAPFLKTDLDLWRRMMDVNLDGTYRVTQAALPDMLAVGWGRIVNVASVAGLVGAPYISAYCAAKHGIVGLTRALATELATKGITVNAVCPGYTDTDMVRDALTNIVFRTGRTHEQALAELTARNPQKRLVTPEEVANAVAWLCLPGSEAITGQAITVAGGEVM
ncbi:MAG TPA: SDR family NAD(P)-dependent oxidoreductase [Bryobacteraceae bacterium]|nr:SDR family NAD(P)-dependent oxidoreductase [Bryobacteraceae bacterium]